MNKRNNKSLFSYFRKGMRNKEGKAVMCNQPKSAMTVADAYAYITNYNQAGKQTEQLQLITEKQQQREFKVLNFEYTTFCATFSYRDSKHLLGESGLMVIDIDKLRSNEEAVTVKELLCRDTHYVTVLAFISPSGNGVKWIVERQPLENETYRQEFDRMFLYVAFEYGIAIDTSGSDLTRPCYLPFDKECFINSKYLIQ